eukprot:1152322-Pelagomonas_calceolata.AAC.5
MELITSHHYPPPSPLLSLLPSLLLSPGAAGLYAVSVHISPPAAAVPAAAAAAAAAAFVVLLLPPPPLHVPLSASSAPSATGQKHPCSALGAAERKHPLGVLNHLQLIAFGASLALRCI